MHKKYVLSIFLAIFLGLFILSIMLPSLPLSLADRIGNPNVSVVTRVNVSNAAPYVYNISVMSPITLTPNTTTSAWCAAYVQDYNNWSDIAVVNATFYDATYSQHNSIDFNTTHYTNASCNFTTEVDSFTKLYNCSFSLWYNSNPGSWVCNITAADVTGITDTKNISATVNELISLMVPDEINFGNVPVTNHSNNVYFNITNVGNRKINVSLYAFGTAENDTLAMVCQYGNISLPNERYAVRNASDPFPFDVMNLLNNSNSTASQIPLLTISQYNQTYTNSVNETVWRLYVPVGPLGTPSGLCNGTVVFRAIRWA